jgi:hypothetical protein
VSENGFVEAERERKRVKKGRLDAFNDQGHAIKANFFGCSAFNNATRVWRNAYSCGKNNVEAN